VDANPSIKTRNEANVKKFIIQFTKWTLKPMCINTNLILVCSIISLGKIWLYNHILQLLCFNSMYLYATTTTSLIYITMEEPKLHFWNCLRALSVLSFLLSWHISSHNALLLSLHRALAFARTFIFFSSRTLQFA